MQPKANIAVLYFAAFAGTGYAFPKTELNHRCGTSTSTDNNFRASGRNQVIRSRTGSHGGRKLSLSSNRDDFGGQSNGSYSEGEALAKEFYDHLKNRDASTAPRDENEEYRRLYQKDLGDDPDDEPQSFDFLPEDEARRRNRDPFINRREVRAGKYDIPAPLSGGPSKSRRKFTGRSDGMPRLDSTGTPSAGLFSGDGGSVFSVPAERVVRSDSGASGARSQMMLQELFMGPATSERMIILQALVVLLFLSFSIYVGLNGGITNGSDRFGLELLEFNSLGESVDFFSAAMESGSSEELVGAASSSGGSVWL